MGVKFSDIFKKATHMQLLLVEFDLEVKDIKTRFRKDNSLEGLISGFIL
jgi:hypothetical protein